MSHVSSSTVELDGVKARVILEQWSDDPTYVKVTLNVEPPNRGLDAYPYSATVKKPEARRAPGTDEQVLGIADCEDCRTPLVRTDAGRYICGGSCSDESRDPRTGERL